LTKNAGSRKPCHGKGLDLRGVTVTFVGEADPRGTGNPLGRQPGRAGSRLVAILGLDGLSYDRCRRVNLCGIAWDRGEAARAARSARLPAGSVVVLLGRRVAGAFGYNGDFFSAETRGDVVLVGLPHPSGRCRTWNDPTSAVRARAAVARAVSSQKLKGTGRA
jgi:hypothetical protein